MPPRPSRALLIVAGCIVGVEAATMVVLRWLPPMPSWAEVLLDASTLITLVSPVLYHLIYRPQQRYLTELRNAAAALEAGNRDLEYRVAERTRELRESNGRLDDTVRRLEMQNRGIRVLAEMVEVFQACHTSNEAHETISRYAEKLFPGTSGSIAIFRESRNMLETVAQWGLPANRDHGFAPQECWGLRRGRPHAVANRASAPHCKHLDHEHQGAAICVPMMAQGTAIGVLSLLPADSDGSADQPADLAGLAALAIPVSEQIALALANLTLRETLRYQAVRDPLTGLFNRRYLEETQPRELLRAQRRQLSIGIAMLDLDHFKRFNDTYGHHGGDALLADLGALLLASLRPEDIACRLGGEEFLLVMPETSLDAMSRRMEQLRESVARLVVESRGQRLGSVTISIGVAEFPSHGGTAEELMRAADRALYDAKARGRNQVVVADLPPPIALAEDKRLAC